jgi:hypothetical protein
VEVDRARISELLMAVAAELNSTQPSEHRLEPLETSLLNADGGHLSSLAVVAFILAVEEKLRETLASQITLFDESLIAEPNGPFRTIGSLVDHIHAMLRAGAA